MLNIDKELWAEFMGTDSIKQKNKALDRIVQDIHAYMHTPKLFRSKIATWWFNEAREGKLGNIEDSLFVHKDCISIEINYLLHDNTQNCITIPVTLV